MTLGAPPFGREDTWTDYSTLGVTADHAPDLSRLFQDRSFHELDENDPRAWAPLHAWRALAQRQLIGIDLFLEHLEELEEDGDDWFESDFAKIVTLFGPSAIPPLAEFLTAHPEKIYGCGSICGALTELVRAHPECREAILDIFRQRLEDPTSNDPHVNAVIISEFVQLQVREAAPLIERAFDRDLVDETVTGSWEYVRYELGLGPKPREPRYPSFMPNPFFQPIWTPADRAKGRSKARRREKKRQRQARKQNRR